MSLSLSEGLRLRLPDLPVSAVLDRLVEALGTCRLCALSAPAGSGKTLSAPLWLWEAMAMRRVFVLVPRRVNARLPVLFLRESLGPLVGYRIRFETLWDQGRTRIGYLTYGTALRAFRDDPPGADDLVIFDEFHERPWEADLLLATLRREGGPRLLLMSATLNRDGLPPGTPVVESDGRLFAVEQSWESTEPSLLAQPQKLVELVRRRSAELFHKAPGEQLIFLPGMAAIRQLETALKADPLPGEVDILHSSLPEAEIRRVVERGANAGFRRVLSTDLAESSVTLPGVKVVIDSGLKRQPRRDPFGLGITLETVRAPLASLVQRAGRAGRTQHGRCHRLLTRSDEQQRDAFAQPEIRQVDGKTVALHLAALGRLGDWTQLPWLCPPDQEELEEALSWLRRHELITENALSWRGERVLNSTCSPRTGLFGCLAREQGQPTPQVVDYCSALEDAGAKPGLAAQSLSERLGDRHWRASRDPQLLERLSQVFSFAPKPGASGQLALSTAYGETLVALRGERAVPAFLKSEALWFRSAHPPDAPYALVLSTVPAGGGGPNSAVSLYQPLKSDEVWETYFEQMEETLERSWEVKSRSVKEIRRTVLGQLVLEQEQRMAPAGVESAHIFLDNLSEQDLGEAFLGLRRRLELFFTRRDDLARELYERLGKPTDKISTAILLDFLQRVERWSKSSPQELFEHARGLIGYETGRELDRALPTSVQLPRRRQRSPIVYPEQGSPYISSKLQDFFGWTPPPLLYGELKLACHLLAPSGRPVQITEDLERFWRGSYAQVRKDLRGRYPKHDWPENPP